MANGIKFNYPGSNKNSTDTPLGAGGVFMGEPDAISITENSQSVSVTVCADVASADLGLEMQFSMDGTNWDHIKKHTVSAGKEEAFEHNVRHRYFRVIYTTVSAQASFRLQTIYHTRFGADGDPSNPVPVRISDGDTFGALSVDGTGAFGDIITAELLPQAQVDFVYGLQTGTMDSTEVSTGAVTFASSMVVCTSGASVGGISRLDTFSTARYRPGQGLVMRFSCVFGAGATGVRQLAGGNGFEENGLFFGVNDVDGAFGVCRRHGGLREIQTLTVSAAATGAETGTVTLNGTGYTVPLTSGSIAATAQEIAEGTYAGWQAWAAADLVFFMADDPLAMAGAFTFSSTGTAAGTLAEDTTGTAPTYSWVAQTAWNGDRMDGTGPSGVTLDQTMGNVYTIKMQYLGFGAVDYLIESPGSGLPQLVHRIEYANANTTPLMGNPTMNVSVGVENVSAGTSTVIKSASMGIFTEGQARPLGPTHGVDVDTTISAVVPVLSVRNNLGFVNGVSRLNVRDLLPLLAGFATANGSKTMRYSIIRGGVLTNPLWTLYDASHSVASVDSSATAITGGDVVVSSGLARDGDNVVSLVDYDLHLHPGQTMSLIMEPTGTAADIVASLSFKEDV